MHVDSISTIPLFDTVPRRGRADVARAVAFLSLVLLRSMPGYPCSSSRSSTPGIRHEDVSCRLATRARYGCTPLKQVCREHFARKLSAQKPPVYTVFSLQSAGLINYPSRAIESKAILTSHASPFAIPTESQRRNS